MHFRHAPRQMRTDLPDVMVAEPDVTRVRLERRSAQVAALALDRPHSSHADWSEPFLTSPRPPAPAVPDEVGPHIVLRVVRYEPIRSALTAARREAGLTISDLARSLHVSRPTVSGWNEGPARPPGTTGRPLRRPFASTKSKSPNSSAGIPRPGWTACGYPPSRPSAARPA